MSQPPDIDDDAPLRPPIPEGWPDNMPLGEQVERLGKFLMSNREHDFGKPDGRSEGAIEMAHRLLIQLQHESEHWRRKWERAHLWNTDYRAKLHRDAERFNEEYKPPHWLLRWFGALPGWVPVVFGIAVGVAISQFG